MARRRENKKFGIFEQVGENFLSRGGVQEEK
jgi:hypothetical protein